MAEAGRSIDISRARRRRLRWVTGWWPLLKQTLADWWEDKAQRLGASLAFYTVLSLAPLLVIVTPILGSFLGEEPARQGIAKQFEQLVGPEGAGAIEVMLQNSEAVVTGGATTAPTTIPATTRAATQHRPSRLAWTLSLIVLVFGATNVFAELQDSLNTIWEVTPKPGRAAVWDFVRQRLLSFAMVMAICFLLLVSLEVSTLLDAVQAFVSRTPVETTTEFWKLVNNGVTFAVVTALFGLIFKVLPDVKLKWRDVGVGALLTAALFTVGRHLIGQYLGRAGGGQRYGAGGSLVALLVWVYYSAQIVFLGAEFTKVWSHRAHGGVVKPTKDAVPVTEEARAQVGISHKEVVQAVQEVVKKNEQSQN
jgi:membrane protein